MDILFAPETQALPYRGPDPVGGDSRQLPGSVGVRKRVLTEARRGQNRQAQRAYRQRQREQQKAVEDKVLRPLRPKQTRIHAVPGTGDGGNLLQSEADGAPLDPLDDALAEVYQSIVCPYSAPAPAPALAPLQAEASLALSSPPSWPALSPWTRQPSHVSLPDPHLNCLHFLPTTIFSAILHNAHALGFDLFSLATCGLEYLSPYYCPDARLADDPEQLLEGRLASHESGQQASTLPASRGFKPPSQVPQNLRPSIAQLLIPHHASLDLIPIPTLREQAIMLSAAMPHLFSLYELKLDIYVRGGLMPWRENNSHAPRSAPDTAFDANREENRRIGEPWEPGSWEAAPWFLRKWSMIVGGEKGELGRRSEWWRIVRENRRAWGSHH